MKFKVNNIFSGYYHGTAAVIDRLTFLLLFLVVGRIFGADNLGIVAVSLSFGNLLSVISDHGAPEYFQREASKRTLNISNVAASYLAKILITLSLLLIIPLYSSYTKDVDNVHLFSYTFIAFLFSASNVFNSIVIGRSRAKEYFYAVLISRLTIVILILTTVFYNDSQIVFYSLLLGSSTSLLLSYRYFRKDYRFHFPLRLDFTYIKYSLTIWVGLITIFAIDKIDLLLLTSIKSANDGGLYQASYTVFKSVTIFSSFYLVEYYNRFSKLISRVKELTANFFNSLILSFIAASAIGIVLGFFAEELIIILYGDAFNESVYALQILCIAIPFMIMAFNISIFFNSQGKFYIPTVSNIIALIYNITGNILVIEEYGIYGCAFVTLTTYILLFLLQLVVYLIVFHKNYKT